jgi:biotin transport system permease protein
LRRLGLPTQILETAIPLVIRFSPVLIAKAGQLVEAWRARSRRRPGWQLVLPLSLAALDDADHVAEALRARGGTLK